MHSVGEIFQEFWSESWGGRGRGRGRRRWQEMLAGDLSHGSYMELWWWQCAVWQSMHLCPKWQWAQGWIPLSSVCIEISSAALFSGRILFLQKGWVSAFPSLSKLFPSFFLFPILDLFPSPSPPNLSFLLAFLLAWLLACCKVFCLLGDWKSSHGWWSLILILVLFLTKPPPPPEHLSFFLSFLL